MNRRGVVAGLAAVMAIAAGRAAWKFGLLRKHYPPTPYDDLLNQIVDRDPAAKLGAVAARRMPGVTVAELAARLRRPGAQLAARAPLDCTQGLVSEVGGWIVPQSVALYAVLASRV
jgi:hypothetical protein